MILRTNSAGSGGTVWDESYHKEPSLSIKVTGSGNVRQTKSGTQRTLTALADSEWTFSRWTDSNDTTLSTDSTYTLTLTSDTTVIAVFYKLVTVSITGTGHANSCYAIINGTKYYNAITTTARVGSEIILCVYSGISSETCYVMAEDAFLIYETGASTKTTTWYVLDSANTISLNFSSSRSYIIVAT